MFEEPIYDRPKNWVRDQKQNLNRTWEQIRFLFKTNETDAANKLTDKIEEEGWPQMDYETWKQLVNTIVADVEAEDRAHYLENLTDHEADEDNAITVPADPNSSWQKYRTRLHDVKHFSDTTIDGIEKSALKILRKLKRTTPFENPIKGLVFGNVQSGKTANMAAVMAMAADWGWNMFIVLSGTIENLRKQTQDRLVRDLVAPDCNITWNSLNKDILRPNMEVGDRARDRQFGDGEHQAYLTVCLKNSTRLRNLIKWMQEDGNTQSQMKVLLIDDESDQAGVNTHGMDDDQNIDDQERTIINGLMCNLVNGKDSDNNQTAAHFACMNYIGYTATPYANVLNETRAESLYPKDFIIPLPVSKEYFGPQQIFGITSANCNYDGLNIIREVSDNDILIIKEIHQHDIDGQIEAMTLPDSLKNAVCWFLCGVSCMRHWDYEKPISMLVHTSQRTEHHEQVANAIRQWLNDTDEDEIIETCRNLWENETAAFSRDMFYAQYPDYARNNVRDYPTFDQIEDELIELLEGADGPDRVTALQLGDDHQINYHAGIHLCVDNCANNGVRGEEFLRIVYPPEPDEDHPEDWENYPSPAPAFIVVGGATLSRGLTIEGLVSTFFLRTVKTLDTLMQMGRWFGYRRKYELIPRVWLSEDTKEKFTTIAEIDQSLRDSVYEMLVNGISPLEMGPSIMNTPNAQWLTLTNKNRCQAMIEADYDFRTLFKQTYLFEDNLANLSENLELTIQFFNGLGASVDPDTTAIGANSYVWRGISNTSVCDYLRQYHFHNRLQVLNDIETFIEWITSITENGNLDSWNVILVGKDGDPNFTFGTNGQYGICKVSRSRKRNRDFADIGALTAPTDLYGDVNLNDEMEEQVRHLIQGGTTTHTRELRELAGLGRTPLLLVYIVDKDSQPEARRERSRETLNAPVDIVGIAISIPSGGRDVNVNNYVAHVTGSLPNVHNINEIEAE